MTKGLLLRVKSSVITGFYIWQWRQMYNAQQRDCVEILIVNNKNNGVDVDKWDYFIRDSHACGFPSNFDKERAVSVLRVRPYETDIGIQANVLAFPLKDQINLYNMFSLRFTLHSKVYQHIVVKSVEEIFILN
ncbi:hypothetical protein KUTeg_015088 [Tegillarca granosa]|uniref:Uncharacterized protein n=1 Tax=Tegillarca granosa TaxID=220873 RepID=A0ABQ9EPS5_TEGGR|nr:hypothetical protein KUTeg_015088 [Tegillarca granosa]